MLPDELIKLRKDYSLKKLREQDVDPSPFTQFLHWLHEALAAKLPEPHAAVLATATRDGNPSARVVLVRGFDDRGPVFFTNYESRKGRELESNPRASLVFYWADLERQIRIEGTAEKTSREESERYFQIRPAASRIGAWASNQSSMVPSRDELDRRFEEFRRKFKDDHVPLPPYWGGYRVAPDSFEFWQGRENRMHDRLLYTKVNGGWKINRLAP